MSFDFSKKSALRALILVLAVFLFISVIVSPAAAADGDFIDKIYETLIEDDRYQYLLTGLQNTLIITVFSLILGLVLGALIAIVRTVHDLKGRLKLLNLIARGYLTVIRGTPVLIQLLIIYFVIFASVDVALVPVAIVAIKNILNVGVLIVLIQSIKWANSESQIMRRGEFYELLLVTLFGMYLMISANLDQVEKEDWI